MLLAENVALSIPKDVGLQEGENEKTKVRKLATFPTGTLLVPLQTFRKHAPPHPFILKIRIQTINRVGCIRIFAMHAPLFL